MMYCEFIERTGYGETYITESMYHDYIEPSYMTAPEEVTKDAFCKCFYNIHNKKVNEVVEGLITAKSLTEKEQYIAGEIDFSDIEEMHHTLRNIFLKAWNGIYKNFCIKVYDD